MDKLQPILKQKFWILLGVGVIMTIVGWWMATGSLAATIAARKTALDGVEKMIPSGEVPNNDWSAKLAEINAKQKVLVDVARREMWERQKARRFWPPTVNTYAEKIPNQGDFPVEAMLLYRDNYMHDVELVWSKVRPYKPLDQSGVILFNMDRFPYQKGLANSPITPTSKEMWEYQEDLWLLVPLMEAIRNVNGGENSTRQDAVVHVIEKLQLMGGDREKLSAGAGGGGGGGSEGAYSGGEAAEGSGLALGGFGGGFGGSAGGALGGTSAPASADFDPKEEYGDGGTPGGGGGGVFGAMSGSSSFGGGEAAEGGEGTGAAAGPVVRRYVDDAESLPYKTRAFYLSVVMDHRKVPTLLAELTANGESDWPIEIGRVQMVRLNPDEGMSQQGGGASLAGGFGGGTMPFGGAGGPYGGESSSSFPAPPLNTTSSFGEPSGESSFEGALSEGAGAGYSGTAGAVGFRGFEATFTDPYLARVALCGLIYIYKEVAPQEASAATTEPPAPATVEPATPSATEAGATPTDQPTPTPAPAETDLNAPQPASTEPAASAPAPAANTNPAAAEPKPE